MLWTLQKDSGSFGSRRRRGFIVLRRWFYHRWRKWTGSSIRSQIKRAGVRVTQSVRRQRGRTGPRRAHRYPNLSCRQQTLLEVSPLCARSGQGRSASSEEKNSWAEDQIGWRQLTISERKIKTTPRSHAVDKQRHHSLEHLEHQDYSCDQLLSGRNQPNIWLWRYWWADK